MRRYFSFSHLTSGFIAVMVGFTSSSVLIFQAAKIGGASPAEISSWLFALGMAISISCISLSWYHRMPILVGTSTPGAALLMTSLSGVPMSEAIGAFLFAALLTILVGVTGMFERVMSHIPKALASAMLAGILLHFGLNIFVAMQDQAWLVGLMLLTYLLAKRFYSHFAIIFVLLVGVCIAKTEGLFHLTSLSLEFATPIFIAPTFSWLTLVSVGIPLFVVTMTSQNVPGIAVLQAFGFRVPISSTISWIGLMNCLFAVFGCYSISLTALTAAMCAGEDADLNPSTRYKATIFGGLCWVAMGLFGTTIVGLFYAFPKELIAALAGLALLGTIAHSLKHALDEESQREPALLTILISASGVTLFGIGAAFWGLLVGILSSMLLNGYKVSWALSETR